jgi:hypothetical protein
MGRIHLKLQTQGSTHVAQVRVRKWDTMFLLGNSRQIWDMRNYYFFFYELQIVLFCKTFYITTVNNFFYNIDILSQNIGK